MGIRPSSQSGTSVVDKYLGSSYDSVATVAENIDAVVNVSNNLNGVIKYIGAYTVAPTTKES